MPEQAKRFLGRACGRGVDPPRTVRAAESVIPTPYGTFRFIVYRDIATGKEHAALVGGDVAKAATEEGVLVRIHSECLTGDIFGSMRCDCGAQLREALSQIGASGGVLVYLRQEGRDIGLTQKILAYDLQDRGLDTVEANLRLGHPEDPRTYGAARDILSDLGIASVRLLTNNPRKIDALEGFGIHVAERIPLLVSPTDASRGYLATKRDKLGHMLD